MKGLIDMGDSEVESHKYANRPKKSSEEELKEKIYEARVKLVQYSKTDYSRFIKHLRENENLFLKMNQTDKECMRRTCDRASDLAYSMADNDYFDKIFGPYIDPRKSKTIPEMNPFEFKESKMTLEQEIAFRSKGSYFAMWDFITNPSFQEQLKGREDLYDSVKYMIDRAKKNNEAVLRGFKRYEPSDEEMYAKVLALMKVKT